MEVYITIDGGTTNTRIALLKNREIIDIIKLNVGVRANIENPVLLQNEIKCAIEKILTNNHLKEENVIRILASGMITSEFGLCNLEHIKTPVGINELHNSMHEITLKEISNIPFVFIRGVKNDATSYENADIMRGEESELIGIMKREYGQCIYVLPGSHSKIIQVDEFGMIIDFSTMLTGEMIFSLSQHTILKDAVDLSVTEIDNEFLLKGYDYCKGNGINKALFKLRILKNIYSFFMGIVLCGDAILLLIIFLLFQRYILGGITVGGVKENNLQNFQISLIYYNCDMPWAYSVRLRYIERKGENRENEF